MDLLPKRLLFSVFCLNLLAITCCIIGIGCIYYRKKRILNIDDIEEMQKSHSLLPVIHPQQIKRMNVPSTSELPDIDSINNINEHHSITLMIPSHPYTSGGEMDITGLKHQLH